MVGALSPISYNEHPHAPSFVGTVRHAGVTALQFQILSKTQMPNVGQIAAVLTPPLSSLGRASLRSSRQQTNAKTKKHEVENKSR
jgi:hypothetical protein